jgi:hypothetical protein
LGMSDQLLRIPEVARRLGIDGTDVYKLIESGALLAGKGEDGLVYVTEDAVSAYRRGTPAATTP